MGTFRNDREHEKVGKTELLSGQAYAALQEAFEFAKKMQLDLWQCSVSFKYLEEAGVESENLAKLVTNGIASHAEEIDSLGNVRCFRKADAINFREKTCFVLNKSLRKDESSNLRPTWDADTGEFRFAGQLIKKFRWHAPNQKVLLDTFQRLGWPNKIDDPFKVDNQVEPKRRLHDTIKCLNRRHLRNVIRFHGDGTGTASEWRFVERDALSFVENEKSKGSC